MRLATLSDLHIDHPGNVPVVDAMLARLRAAPPDVLVLAGDLASDIKRVAQLLLRAVDIAPKVVYVPGNHDLWSPVGNAEEAGHDTWLIYRELLREICAQLGVHYLPAGALTVGTRAIVGVTGWYDFSLATRFARLWFTDQDFAAGHYSHYGWADIRRTCFRRDDGTRMTDDEVVGQMVQDLEAQLRGLEPTVTSVACVTHVQAFREVVVSRAIPAWDYFSAFMGSARLGETMESDPRVRIAVYGHTHTPGDRMVGSIRVLGTPLGYPREWNGHSTDALVRSRIGWLEL